MHTNALHDCAKTPELFFLSGLLGFLANCVVIPVLFTKKMCNTFSRFLVCLALFDNIYVGCVLLECFRKYVWTTQWHSVSRPIN